MKNREKEFEEAKKRYEENLAGINYIKKLTIAFVVSAVISIGVIPLCFNNSQSTFLWVVLMVALLCAGLLSYACGKAAGHGVVGLDELGGGGGAILSLPFYYILMMFYVIAGWVFGVVAMSKMSKENNDLIALYGDKISSSEAE